jgi:uncharacterized integral membrane protein
MPKSKAHSFHSYRAQNAYKKGRKWQILGVGVIILLVVVVFAGVSQIDKIREFFSQASGDPAHIIIDTQELWGETTYPWQNLAQGGESPDWQLGPVVDKTKALQPQYIRIDHIYDFYDIVQGSPGNLSFDFSGLDPILTDILATGAKPYIALTYMPDTIATGDIVSKPQRWQDWQLTVQKTIEHISGTRGINDVYYEVWNEPDLFGGWKYYGDKNYLTLYSYSIMGAQQAKTRAGVKSFKIGGPAITALYRNWFHALAKHALQNNLQYDFFSWHRYDHDVDVFAQDIQQATSWKLRYPALAGDNFELHITEWGPDSENHTAYDTKYGAAHAAAAGIYMANRLDKAFVFEIQDGKDANGSQYWGRWGLLTHQDFGSTIKPRYNVLKLMNRLRGQRLGLSGQGSWVKAMATGQVAGTKQANKPAGSQLGELANQDEPGVKIMDPIMVLLANFDQYGQHSEAVPITFENIEPGDYEFTLEYLSGRTQVQPIATTAAKLGTVVSMPPNSVMLGVLKKQ